MKYLIILFIFIPSLTLTGQQVTTIAQISTNYGDGMIVTPDGDILVSGGYNKNTISKITPLGVVTTFIGGLPGPVGMGFDSFGNLYVSNYTGNSISKITPGGVVTEFASNLDGPAGLIVSDNDEIFVTLYGDNFSGTGSTVLKFDLQGNVQIYASGSGLLDVIGITMDENSNLYVTNFIGGNVFKINTDQEISNISTISGANINQIVYTNNYVYLPSPNLRKIFRVNINDGMVEHFAGSGDSSTNDGPLLEAGFNLPNSCAINASGDTMYILDKNVGLIRALDLSGTLGLNDIQELTIGYSLEQNFPNPFNETTNIRFTLPKEEKVTLEVYSIQGVLMEQLLFNKTMSLGDHIVQLNLANCSRGLYLYKLTAGKFSKTKKMIVN